MQDLRRRHFEDGDGGEINCLDPGGFGGVTIIKAISIVCDYTEGGILSAGAGVNGIIINAPGDRRHVFLSGLDLNGAGNAQNGLRFVSGGIVTSRTASSAIIAQQRARHFVPAGAVLSSSSTRRSTTMAPAEPAAAS